MAGTIRIEMVLFPSQLQNTFNPPTIDGQQGKRKQIAELECTKIQDQKYDRNMMWRTFWFPVEGLICTITDEQMKYLIVHECQQFVKVNKICLRPGFP